MDYVDNFETFNSRDWDETSVASRPVSQRKPIEYADVVLRTEQEQKSLQQTDTPRRAATVDYSRELRSQWHNTQQKSSNVKRNVAPEVQEIAEGSSMYQGTSSLDRSVAHLNPQSDHKPGFRGPAGKLSAFWPATPRLVTNRRRADLDKEAEKAILEDMYLKPLPPGTRQRVTGHYLWLNKNVLPEQLLCGHLDLIRKTCKVYIEHDLTYKSLVVSSDLRTNVLEAIVQIKAAALHFKVDADAFAPLYIVEPPPLSAMTEDVCPVYKRHGSKKNFVDDPPTDNVSGNAKDVASKNDCMINESLAAEKYTTPIVYKVVQSGRRLSDDEIHKEATTRNEHIVANQKLILEYVRRSFQKLRGLQSRMRMRVHFGHLELHHYQKSFQKPGISYRKFVKMMESPRTKALFDKRVFDLGMASRLVHQIQESSDCFYPADSLTSSLVDVKPKHTFVMFVRAPSNELVRVEAEIDSYVSDESKIIYQIGTTIFYIHNARKTRLQVGVMSFETGCDWSLELVTNDLVDAVPETFQRLVSGCLRASSKERKDQYGFSYPEIIMVEQPGLTVDDARMRTTLRYGVTGTSYMIELSIFRNFSGIRGISPLSGSLGVSFFSANWDFNRGLTDRPPLDWQPGSDLGKLFPSTSNAKDFKDFFVKVKEVQDRLGGVSRSVN